MRPGRIVSRRRIRESFDRDDRTAGALRSLVPPDRDISPERYDRILGHLLQIQRRRAAGSARVRLVPPLRRVILVPAVALLVALAVLAAVLLPMMAGDDKPTPSGLTARLEDLSGRVELKAPDEKWREASGAETAGEGWAIRTGERSSVSVSFPDGSLMRVTDDSKAVLESIETSAVEVDHVSGETYHRTSTGSSYTVNTEDIASEAAGAAFNVGSRVPGELEILSVQQNVSVAIGKHDPIEVTEGEVMIISTAQAKTAVKQPVSRERLADERLRASVEMDAEAGYPTGIYENLDVPLNSAPIEEEQPVETGTLEMSGGVSETGVTLEWGVSPSAEFDALSLLRSEQSEPVYPDSEIALYTNTSIASATDSGAEKGRTYQYRLAALASGEVTAYSNTVVISVPAAAQEPAPASISLEASAGDKGVTLEWSVNGAARFNGFLLERTVQSAPGGSQTPAGTVSTRRVETTNVFFTFQDSSTTADHVYSYRVGLIVDGAVMVYSNPAAVEVQAR